MQGRLYFLAVSASLSLIICRFQFHPAAIAATIFYLFYLYYRRQHFLFFLSLLTVLCFIFVFYFTEHHNKTGLTEGRYSGEGIISSIPYSDGNQYRGYVKTRHGEKLVFTYTIQSFKEKQALNQINPGMICSFSGELKRPKLPTMPNAFNYHQYLHDHHIHWQYQVEEIGKCKAEKSNWYYTLLNLRKDGLAFIEAHFPSESVGIVQALIFGDRRLIDSDLDKAYQELGIVHLLAISGSHIALLAGAIYYFLLYCGMTHEKAKAVLIVLLPVYMILTGASPSVVRASFMVVLYLLIKLCKKQISSLDVISFTYLVLLIINPYYLFQAGFQLSYAVSFGLLLSLGIVEHFNNVLAKLTVVSAIAQLCSMPILLHHFYEISLISLPMNMLFVPLYSFIILPLSILATSMAAIFPLIGVHIIQIFSEMLLVTHKIVLFASSLSISTFVTGRPALPITCALVVAIFYLVYQFEIYKRIKLLLRPALFLALVLLIQVGLPYLNPYGKVIMIDVGQGDSIFIHLPFKKGTFLIDTGGRITFPKEKWEETSDSFTIAEDVTIPYLKSIGITKVDALFLTHGDTDHIGEAIPIMEGIKVEELIIPKGFVREELEQKVIETAENKRTEIKAVKAGDTILFHDFSFYVVAPITLTASKNDDSLVLWTELGGLSWLFTGDAEMGSEEKMISKFPGLRADVLKVGHHGSKGSTSDSFLDSILPSIALVSAGYNNRYQHPHSEVVDKLSSRGIPLLRTDLDGAILYNFKGKTGTFSTHPPYDKVKE
ncbi:DNA internalization-related competence protein ComEC/Rec2 [uncultured Metabacillus sp.]|uniref:DNA internalization-related competence protein ComEC/Rec2 n=1 Tax=uncultured Metabacillus sp. TaxID=2860135 RepID=UPI00261286CD|nr:DNA internalization-related competence protein ComEC/Rec2 [uncultured Metabacillus sp.]